MHFTGIFISNVKYILLITVIDNDNKILTIIAEISCGRNDRSKSKSSWFPRNQ